MNNNNSKKFSNEKMEGYVGLYKNIIVQYQKKYMILDDYNMSIFSSNDCSLTTREYYFHISYFTIENKKSQEKTFSINYFKKILHIKIDDNEQYKYWIHALESSQLRYKKFYNDYYKENNEKSCIRVKFEDMLSNMKLLDSNLANLVINYDLEMFLNKNYLLLKKINDYTNEINLYYYNLSDNSEEENLIKSKMKEIKSLLSDVNVK